MEEEKLKKAKIELKERVATLKKNFKQLKDFKISDEAKSVKQDLV